MAEKDLTCAMKLCLEEVRLSLVRRSKRDIRRQKPLQNILTIINLGGQIGY